MQAMKRLPVRRIPSAAAGHTKLQFNGRSLHIWLPDTESARSFRHSGLIYGDVATPSSHVEDEQQAITTNQLPAAAKATEPTEKLRELMAKDKLLAEKVERIQKEFEIYEYFSSYVPTKFEDKNWLYLLRTNTIIDRVRYYWFMGLVEGRQEQDSVRTKENHSMKVEQFDDGQKIYDAGGMVYRPGFYRHLHNPMTNMKSLIPYGLWNSVEMSMTEQRPKLLFDCQFLHDCAPQFYGRTTQGGAHAYWVNYERRDPLPNAFVNVNKEDPFTQNFITKYVFPLNTSGFHRDYKILPQLHPNNPYHDPNEKDPTKQVIYISKFAKEQLDGPLIHKAYVIPLAFDKFRETIGAARRGNYRTMYLPIRKYIKWRSGAIKIPFVGLVNIFNEVANNGGDWAYALEKFIPRLNKMSLDERKQQIGKGRHQKIMDEREERQRISTTIFESLGQQPVIFAPEQDTKTRATILEYARSLEKF